MWKLLVLTALISVALVKDASCGHISRSRRAASRKPSITSTDSEFTRAEGEDVTLPCNVKNLGRSYVIWKKDDADIIKLKKMGRQWKIHPPHSSLYKKSKDNGDFSLDETSLTLHNVDAEDQGTYLCYIENQDAQVEHTLKITANEEDYYDYDYYNYEELYGTENENEQDKKDGNGNEASLPSTDVEEVIKEDNDNKFNIDDDTNMDNSVPKNVNSKSPSNEYETDDDNYYDDDYFDYYGDIESTDKSETQIEDPEEVETTVSPHIIEESTTEIPTLPTILEPTEPARTWSWSFWSSGSKSEVTATNDEKENNKKLDENESTDKDDLVTKNENSKSPSSESDSDDDYYYDYDYTTTPEPTPVTSKSPSSEYESYDDYDDYHDEILENTDDGKTQIKDPENGDTQMFSQTVEENTSERPSAPEPTTSPEPTKPALTWNWSFWGSSRKTEVTTTTATPITESTTLSENNGHTYDYYDYDNRNEGDKEDVITRKVVDRKYYEEHDQENMIKNKQEYDENEDNFDHLEEKHAIFKGSVTQVSVGKNGTACLRCTLPMSDVDKQQVETKWTFNHKTIIPDGENIHALQEDDLNTLLLTSVKREDLGEYRCIIGEDEAIINLVAFPPAPVYKTVDKNSDGNYEITWEANGLVPIDSYSITYRERDSPLEWWQQEGPFNVSERSSDGTYSHTFRNLQPYTDYEAIVSTIYQDLATTGEQFPFSVKRSGDMYPSSRKPGNGLVRAWMKQPVTSSKDQALELVCMMDTKRRTKFLKMRYPVSVDYTFGEHPDMPVIREPIKVQWFHGKNHESPIEDKGRISSYQKGNNNILRFTSVEPSDLGEYRCQGQTSNGMKEATVQLVAFPPPAKKQEVVELDSGMYKLKWESKGLTPVTSFSITYRKTDSTSEGWNQIGPIHVNEEDNINDEYSYVFNNLQPSSSYDVIVTTIYRDLATTGEPFSFTTKGNARDILKPVQGRGLSYPNMIDVAEVNVWMEQPVVHVDIGASSQLVCVVDDKLQDMQVEWYHGRQKVNTDNNRFINKEGNRNILKFISVSHLDLGTYQCSASNKFGQATAFARLTTADDTNSIIPPQGVLRSEDVTQWWSLTQAIFSDVHKYLKTLTRIPQPA